MGECVGVERWRRGCYFFKNIFLYTFELWNHVNGITDKEGQEKYLGQTFQATKPRNNGAAFPRNKEEECKERIGTHHCLTYIKKKKPIKENLDKNEEEDSL